MASVEQKNFMSSLMVSRSSLSIRKKWSMAFLLLKMMAVYSLMWMRVFLNSDAGMPTTSKNLKKVMSTLCLLMRFL